MLIQCLKNYNNYFNRKLVEREFSPDQVIYEELSANFNPNDGVNANFVAGKATNPYTDICDYLFATDELGTVTHWFIVESQRIRKDQFRLILRRDLIRDYKSAWVNSKALIKKATVDERSPFIFNAEPYVVNQIKVGESLLIDDSRTAWIVGMIDKKTPAQNIMLKTYASADVAVERIEDLFNGIRLFFVDTKVEKVAFNLCEQIYSSSVSFQYDEFSDFSKYEGRKMYDYGANIYANKFNSAQLEEFMAYAAANANRWRGMFTNVEKAAMIGRSPENLFSNEDYSKLVSSFNGKLIREVSTGNVYLVNFVYAGQDQKIDDLFADFGEVNSTAGKIWNEWDESGYVTKNYLPPVRYPNGDKMRFVATVTSTVYEVELILQTQQDITIDIPSPDDRIHNQDAPFDVFCLPFSDDVNIITYETTGEYKANKLFAVSVACEIARELGSFCYDVQILPFAPFGGYLYDDQQEALQINANGSEGRETAIKNDKDEQVYSMVWSEYSVGTKNIPFSISVSNIKMSNICDFCRLSSPNYNGQFEFSPAKNNGVELFNVDFTYLPHNSYIHVNPKFSGLYGEDYDDARGLIFQGNFSINYLSDAWVSYTNSNKNYASIFNRSIQNMDTTHNLQQTQRAAESALSALNTGVSVGMQTANAGSGIIAGAISAGAGAIDYFISENLYQESKSYAQDVHFLQLDNIRALPNSIASTTAYVNNNKIYPIVEFFTCTTEEKICVANAIANNGMNVGVIDFPSNYLSKSFEYDPGAGDVIRDRGFISIQLIDIDIGSDAHVVYELNNELNKGVYTK